MNGSDTLVHYVLRDGQYRLALVTTLGKEEGRANLIVFLDPFEDMDWSNSFNQTPQDHSVQLAQPFFLKVPNCKQDEGKKEPGTWHEIEKPAVQMTQEEKDKKEEVDPASKIVNDPPDEDTVDQQPPDVKEKMRAKQEEKPESPPAPESKAPSAKSRPKNK